MRRHEGLAHGGDREWHRRKLQREAREHDAYLRDHMRATEWHVVASHVVIVAALGGGSYAVIDRALGVFFFALATAWALWLVVAYLLIMLMSGAGRATYRGTAWSLWALKISLLAGVLWGVIVAANPSLAALPPAGEHVPFV